MIKIAFCDDDMEVLHQMNELLDRYRVERNEDITYAAFQSPFELLTEIEKGIRPDILFLDVVMPGQNGMDVAKEIRQYDTNMKIIFLTSSPEFAVESYSVGAYFYQLKPIWEESFFRLMDAVLAECEKKKKNSLIPDAVNPCCPIRILKYRISVIDSGIDKSDHHALPFQCECRLLL